MRLSALLDGQDRDRYLSIAYKSLLERVRRPTDSRAIVVLGKQRSGTSMLMYAFHRHPDIMVYDEHRNNPAFINYRLRDRRIINDIVRGSSFPGVCFKPICDSHLVRSLVQEIEKSHVVWVYRDFLDVANSSLRKFDSPTRAIRLICEGKQGGGWLQEGITPDMQTTLSDLYSEGLSDFELSCLVWWARNRCIVDSGLMADPNVSVLKYESLVTQPRTVMPGLFERIGIRFAPATLKRLNQRSIRRHAVPEMNRRVRELCEDLMTLLDGAYSSAFPGSRV